MKKSYIFFILFLALTILSVFWNWFFSPVIVGGDFPYLFPSMYSTQMHFSFAWVLQNQSGLGGIANIYQGTNLAYAIPIFVFGTLLHFPWSIIERVGFFLPFLVLGVFTPFMLYTTIYSNKKFGIFSSFLFIFNSYMLLLVTGGQIIVAISCALAFLTFAFFVKLYFSENYSHTIWTPLLGLCIGVLLFLDLQFAYIAIVGLGILLITIVLTNLLEKRKIPWLFVCYAFFIPLVLSVFLNCFWILPTIHLQQNPLNQLGESYTSDKAVRFFSFAKFENTIGLMHPNWPENIFGKVGFMKPEFLLYPIIAFSTLFFIHKKGNKTKQNTVTLGLLLIGFVGIFIGKGTNDPFGASYLWLFHSIPGFILFRDSTKWYLLIVVSYVTIIPFALQNFLRLFEKKLNRVTILCLGVIVFLLLVFPVKQAFLGQLGGTLEKREVPIEYTKLEEWLDSQKDFSRVLWIPSLEKFGYFSDTHPAVSSGNYFQGTSISTMLLQLPSIKSRDALQQASIKYIIVPDDSTKDTFFINRKYSEQFYRQTVQSIQQINWLTEIHGFDRIHVFLIPSSKDHFWLDGSGEAQYKFIDPTHYKLTVKNVTKGERIIFTESYDKYWIAQNNSFTEHASVFYGRFNSFLLPRSGTYSFDVFYTLQKWVNIGLWISGISFIGVLFIYFLQWRNRNFPT